MRTNAKEWLQNPQSILFESVGGDSLVVAEWAVAKLQEAANDSAILSDGQAFYLKGRILDLSKKTPVDYSTLADNVDRLAIFINTCH